MTQIAEYDKFDYDYSTYWTQRVYENLAEKNILNKIFSQERGKWFLDVGGSYGRLASTYAQQYKNPVIIDYSLKTLQKNKEIINSKYPNIILVAANAYNMPFRQKTFDAGLMVRVLHHIKEPSKYFTELTNVLKNDALYVQEFANKMHIKASLRALFRLDISFFNQEVYEQPVGKNLEGSKKNEKDIFLNYHPKHLKKLLQDSGFKLKKRYGCSFLRSPLIKNLLSEDIMLFLEKIMQNTLSWTNIPPSIFLKHRLEENSTEKKRKEKDNYNCIEDILVCPKCKGTLDIIQTKTALCTKCSSEYFKKEGIWDFRVK